ncbi:MAG: glycoside hydrolase family 97 protein [Bacteroidales bacterium]|nr:glycoside hydrolase family 97 protein [Bacteroidales bacterium]
MKRIIYSLVFLCFILPLTAKSYELKSPDGCITLGISTGNSVCWTLSRNGVSLINPSEIALTLDDGTIYGGKIAVRKALRRSVSQTVPTQNFKRATVHDSFNELKLCTKDFDIVFRAYDDGVAYRFITHKAVTIASETAQFSLAGDWPMWVPYVRGKGTFEKQFDNSFENYYMHFPASSWDASRLAFLPLTVDGPGGVKLCFTEADLLNYPGMYLNIPDGGTTMQGVYAPYPKDVIQGGHNMLQGKVKTREPFIYKGSAAEALPWRVVAVAEHARNLAESDLVWKLAKPAEGDFSWVRPGKVAWDWWNDWNLYGVDFRAGINNDTYKYYIDFAASHGIEYVILDEGWAVNKKADLFQVVPELDLGELSSYAISKGVGLILWAGYWAFNRDMETICSHYSKMGIAGWKIDFLNRDDQDMVAFCEKAAKTAAKYHQIVDFHGVYKPAGLTRTWPNVLNFEGVNGLEQLKWSKDFDIVTYDVTIPFTRYVAGPADYTQGAMRNAKKDNYRPVNSEPVSQGTRCHQLAEYIVFDAPFTMLCDSPSNYLKEPECTRFIASVPTVWDETIALDGQIGEYVVIARRSGSKWYIGALTNWEARDISITLPSEIAATAAASAELWRDGINADRAACDYKRESIPLNNPLSVHLAPGGGFVLVVE